MHRFDVYVSVYAACECCMLWLWCLFLWLNPLDIKVLQQKSLASLYRENTVKVNIEEGDDQLSLSGL